MSASELEYTVNDGNSDAILYVLQSDLEGGVDGPRRFKWRSMVVIQRYWILFRHLLCRENLHYLLQSHGTHLTLSPQFDVGSHSTLGRVHFLLALFPEQFHIQWFVSREPDEVSSSSAFPHSRSKQHTPICRPRLFLLHIL